ncbi:hypothetical protein [Leptotrichia hofstadii]|uniref:hypothetical protein n=1 Tax=Leptotrichia hofstadii TaxID=157688 RepID=UPI0004118A5C|nr:hypothetical protein [Leptotrichia hofstadii]
MFWGLEVFFVGFGVGFFIFFFGGGVFFGFEVLGGVGLSLSKKKKKMLQCRLIRELENMKKDRWLPEGKDSTTFLI